MAYTRPLPEGALARIARQLAGPAASLLVRGDEAAPKKSGELAGGVGIAESFPIWLLREDALAQPSWKLENIAENTHLWHHQITVDGRAAAYAQSGQPEGGEHQLCGLFRDPLAQAVERAIDEVDDLDIYGTAEARLLAAPAFQLTALWLIDRNQSEVLLVEAPAGRERLRHRRFSDQKFLELMRSLPAEGGRLRT